MKQKFNIAPFVTLGNILRKGVPEDVVTASISGNSWFTPESVAGAIEALADDMLTDETLSQWLSAYADRPLPDSGNVAVIMAGNIPASGFFDLMCVLLCGHRALLKPSSKDRTLPEWLCGLLRQIEPGFSIEWLDEKKPDAVIATGSDATRRHFESTYAGIPTLLRGTRHSVAVLTGKESERDLEGLSEDIFLYFGLGCRNISRLFLPHGYDTKYFVEVMRRNPLIFTKYLNGYRQRRTICLMNGEPFIDGGFFMLRERDAWPDAISEITCTHYNTICEIERWLDVHDSEWQCVVSHAIDHPRRSDFGQAQHPRPWDYPDGADVILFLTDLP